jgi:MFS family permease
VLLIVLHLKETAHHSRFLKEEISFLDRFRTIGGDKNLLHFMWVTSVFTVFATAVEVEILYITFGPLKADALLTTVMFVFWTSATVLAALPAGRIVDKRGRKFGVFISFAFYSLSMAIIIAHYYVLSSIMLIPFAFASLGFFNSFFSVSTKTFLADKATAETRGTVMGLYTTLNGVCGRSFAPIVAGFLFTMYSPISPFIIGLTVSIISTALLTRITSEAHVKRA